MRMKRRIAAFLVAALLAVPLIGCASGDKQQGSSNGGQTGSTPPPGVTKVTFWHAMGGGNGAAIEEMAERFNKSHDNIQVEAIFQGNYDDLFNKLKIAGSEGPSVIQVYDIGTRFMIDSKEIVPMQQFIDRDKFDTSDFEPNILGYYTIDDQLYSMPFNTSTPILYYNKTAFAEAGLDPEKPPRTWDEVAEAARKLTVKDGSGNVERYGISLAVYGWFFEQFMARQGALYVDNANGREGMATKAVFNGPEGVALLTWWKSMVDEGIAGNYGRTTADTQKAFQAGTTAMFVDSTAALRAQLAGVDNKFEIGTAFLPHPSGKEDGGVIIGGGSLWIRNDRPEVEQDAAWEFVKWVSAPEQQAFWAMSSGYFPIRKSAHQQPDLVEFVKEYPQFTTAVAQLQATKLTRATQGAVIGVFPQARQTIESAIEEVLLNTASPQAALDKAADTITKAIDTYNKTIQ